VSKRDKAGKLLDILLMRDDKLVPKFWKALVESDQEFVAVMLGYEGLHIFVAFLIYFISLV